MDLDLEEIGLMVINNYALLLQNYKYQHSYDCRKYILLMLVLNILSIEQTSLALGVFK